MNKAIVGKKLGMSQIFAADGRVVPVTVVEAGPCLVVQRKTTESDGYNAIQVGFGEIKERKVTKPEAGHFKKWGVKPRRFVKELRLDDVSTFEVGSELKADIFAEGELVDVTGVSKGKGYAGVIKRWNFQRGPETHGSKYHRRTGSMGTGGRMSGGGGRVFKNKKLSGRLGGERVTVQSLRVVRVDLERNLLLIKGAVPGAKGSLVTIKQAVKAVKA